MAAPDGGWGWIVVAGTFIIMFMCDGVERAFGVWYVEILDRYEAGAGLSTWSIGIYVACHHFLYVLAAFLYVRFSTRTVIMVGGVILSVGLFCSAFANNIYVFYLTFGVIGGLGASLSTFGGQMVISEYFEKRKFLAIALMMTGSGCGSFALSPLLTYLLLNVTYFESVIIVAGIVLNIVVGGSVCFPVYESIEDVSPPLLGGDTMVGSYSSHTGKIAIQQKPHKPQMKVRKMAGDRSFDTDLLCNPVIIIYCIGAFVALLGSFSIPQLVVDYAVEQGESLETASLLLVISGVMEMIIRIGLGFLLNAPFIRPHVIAIWNMSFVAFGVSALIIAFSSVFWHFIPGLVLNIIGHTLARGFSVVMFSSIFEPTALASAFSIYCNVMSIGVVGGGVLAGYIKDVSGSYFYSYLMMACVCLFSSCFYWFNFFLVKRLRHNPQYRLLRPSD